MAVFRGTLAVNVFIFRQICWFANVSLSGMECMVFFKGSTSELIAEQYFW